MSETPILKRIGRYDLERVLGEGAMGVVYEGKDTRLHRKVAIKTILKSALDSSSAKEYSMRFAREAQAVARLNHPNIVQVFDFAEEGDVAYIVMELVRGRELKTFFDAKERFELKETVHIVGELCEALHFAHEAGIIHRDIKPANVMIDAQGRVKLTDFGVARIADPDRTVSDKTQAGMVVGTPAYMSPEQIQGLTLDRRSDIFSVGVILYEFLCGTKPFAGTGAWAIAKKILSEQPEPPSSRNPALSPLFDAVVLKALAKDVEQRYQTARQLGYALQRAAEGVADTDDSERTLRMRAMPGVVPAPGPATGDPTELRTVPAPVAAATKATELEFWRSIKDGNDPADFDLYVEQFPSGIYAALAKRKSAKLRGLASEGQEQERREIEEAARREAEARQKLAEEKAAMEAALARREAEFQQREAALTSAKPKARAQDLDRSGARRARARGGGRRPVAGAQTARPDGAARDRVDRAAGGIQAARSRAGDIPQARGGPPKELDAGQATRGGGAEVRRHRAPARTGRPDDAARSGGEEAGRPDAPARGRGERPRRSRSPRRRPRRRGPEETPKVAEPVKIAARRRRPRARRRRHPRRRPWRRAG